MPAHHRPAHSHHDVDHQVERVLDLLRADGGRITTGRRAVVRALMTAPDHHVTADRVAETVQAQHPDVHLSSIYRTLDALERLDVVARVNLGPGGAVYHLVDHEHHHLVCVECGSVTEIPARTSGPLAKRCEADHDFELSPRHLALTGLCRECRTT